MVEVNDALYRSVRTVHTKIQINANLTVAGNVAKLVNVNILQLLCPIHVLHTVEEEDVMNLGAQMQHMVHYTNVLHTVADTDVLRMAVQD